MPSLFAVRGGDWAGNKVSKGYEPVDDGRQRACSQGTRQGMKLSGASMGEKEDDLV